VKKKDYWVASIVNDGQPQFLGSYTSEQEAAQMYDAAARYFGGLDAFTNFDGTEALSPKEIRLRRKAHPLRRGGASNFVGVSKRTNGRWQAYLSQAGKIRHIGTFGTDEEAAQAYDNARVAHGLPRVNFPDQLQAA
jgi:hypothetical protein